LTQEPFVKRMREYEVLVERLLGILAVVSYYHEGANTPLLTRAIERLAEPARQAGNSALVDLQLYPALLLVYTTGLTALAAKRFRNLAAVLREPRYHSTSHAQKRPAIEELHVWSVFKDTYKAIPRPNAREFTPANNHVFELIRPVLIEYLPSDREYEDNFDLFEYLLALTYSDLLGKSWTPIGRFGWRYGVRGQIESGMWVRSSVTEFFQAGLARGADWDLLKAGFLSGSVDHFKQVYDVQEKRLMEREGW
jgi:hypothetical protein